MKDYSNRRSSERFETRGKVRFVSTNARHPLQAEIINCSEGGLCFETESALPPGSVIFVSAGNDNKFFRAQVRWCQRLAGGRRVKFRIGGQYLDPPS